MTKICPKCKQELFQTIHGWWKCRNCFYVEESFLQSVLRRLNEMPLEIETKEIQWANSDITYELDITAYKIKVRRWRADLMNDVYAEINRDKV